MKTRRPGRRWIITGILLLVSAVVILGGTVAWSVSNFDMQQIVMPGTYEFELDTTSSVDLAYEPMSIIDGVEFASPEDSTMTFQLESLDGLGHIEIREPTIKASYSVFGRHGQIIGTAELEQGRWRLTGVGPTGDDRQAVYAMGPSSLTWVVVPIVVAALIAALLGPLGLGCLIVGIVYFVVTKNRNVASPASPEG